MKITPYVAIATLALTFGCKDKQSTKAEAEDVESVSKPVTAKDRLAAIHTEYGVVNAIDAASMAALRQVEVDGRKAVEAPPASIDNDDATRFTIFFGGNNHGEREDCGCRRNPLGGLARRHTMLNALETGDPEIWADAGPAKGAVFHLDSGDTLYKNSTINRGREDAQAIAKHDARAIVAALNEFPPDAMLAGEIDFAFGAEELQSLAKDAKFPIISANVRGSDGELVFPASVVVEREGVKLGVVGITKKETRWKTFWSDRGLTVDEPLEAAKKAVEELPDDVTMVVLLSNLGVTESRNLIERLYDAERRVHFGVVSNTNRLTAEPEFAEGTPYMEPLSRGKYVGRADFILNGEQINFGNAGQATPSRLRDHRRAVRSYWSTRKQVLRGKQKIEEMNVSLEAVEARQAKADTGVSQSPRNDAVEAQRKRLETHKQRLATVSEALLDQVASFSEIKSAGDGDDWVIGSVVPVKIEIPEVPKTKRVVDRFQKRRPNESAPPGRFKVPMPDEQ